MGGGAAREEAAEGEKGPTQAWVGKGRLAKRNRAAAPAAIDGQGFMLLPAACVWREDVLRWLMLVGGVLCVSCLHHHRSRRTFLKKVVCCCKFVLH